MTRVVRNQITICANQISEFKQCGGMLEMLAASDQAWYKLETKAIDVLMRRTGQQRPFLSSEREKAERTFTWICEAHFAIGFWRGRPIANTPLNQAPPLPTESELLLRVFQGNRSAIAELAPLLQESRSASIQIRGYTGYLLTDPTFLRQVEALRRTWKQLHHTEQPRFPFGRVLRDRQEGTKGARLWI